MKKLLSGMIPIVFLSLLMTGCQGVLDPRGPVADTQYNLIIYSIVLMSLVLIPVFIAFGIIVFKYREKASSHHYEPPEMEGNKKLEILWTIIPIIIVTMLAIPTVQATYSLEKSPSPEQKPLVIKVISAQWKWIFQYPEQGIQTVNYANIPKDRPVKFKLTSAAAMNSFWIPQLGGQKYTMPGMTEVLFLEADETGTFNGKAANFSGKMYSDMTFTISSQSNQNFENWIQKTLEMKPPLTAVGMDQLLSPGTVDIMTYSSYPKNYDYLSNLKGGTMNEFGEH
ncbi:cytochrome aa3 quinol oxidase subunit II [Salibacterium qingdaonense]|uniref:Cytochrome aa3 subunit 2 n=1 Tax=Salibacterium qingdaonense TaxID=266892 RepID=A0A1I4ILV8_9BACI|nr:cytochrome aa3 quinol oxidase subunit II [Salibacterium qingdaonense]SFL55348.1 cytochrome aa3-600 menaquinol oxidase subunit 2 [Salibacterium qingdaonense]